MAETAEGEPRLARTLARFTPGEVDLVLVEGFAHERYLKIEVYRPSHGQPPKCWPGDRDVVAVATDGEIGVSPVPSLDLNDPGAVARFVVELLEGASLARAGDGTQRARPSRLVPPQGSAHLLAVEGP